MRGHSTTLAALNNDGIKDVFGHSNDDSEHIFYMKRSMYFRKYKIL